ncbi:MAG: hypothetical protein OXG38_09730 [Chloroflexi bacterium]|nr:hypothetical protein [Chloroflexota bacterium]
MDEITRRSVFIRDFYNLSLDRFPQGGRGRDHWAADAQDLELIAKASLAAHRAVWDEASLWLKRDWHAGEILGRIEKVNPSFYPQPVRESQVYDSGPLRASWGGL